MNAREILLDNDYRFVTPQMEILFNEVQSWIWAGLPGGVVWGHSRVGKTSSVNYIGPRIRSRGGSKVPFFYAPAKSGGNQSDQKFYNSLLGSFRAPIQPRAPAWKTLRQLLSLLADSATENQNRQIVLCIDEAQYLETMRYRFLIDIVNELQIDQVQAFVLLVGAPELDNRNRSITGEKNANIRGRFFVRSTQLKGVFRKSDFERILAHFDDRRQWGGKVSATQQLLSETEWDGFNLTELKAALWDAYRQEVRDLGFSEWPMQYVMEAIRYLLLEGLAESPRNRDLYDLAIEAIENSGIGIPVSE